MTQFNLDTHAKIASGLKIPEGYFDDFQVRFLEQSREKEVEVISLSRRNRWVYAAAAVLLAALTIPVYNVMKQPTIGVDDIAIENYIDSHSTISDEDFAELLDEKDIKEIKVDSPIEDKAIEDLLSTNSNLEEYIIN